MAEYDDPEEQKATFAQRFIQTGNLDQRRRFAEDIGESARRHEERQAAEFEALQRRDPRLMNAVTNRAQENRMFREGQQRQITEGKRFERLKERDVTADRFRERTLKLSEAANQRAADRALFTQEEEDAADEAALIVEMRESDIRRDPATPPGSPAYKQRMLDLLIKNPDIRKETRDLWLKQVGYEDPDTAIAQAAARMQSNPDISRQTVKLPGGTVTMVKPSPDKTLNKAKTELDRVRVLWDRAKQKGDPSTVEYFEGRIRELEPLTQGTSAPSPATPGPIPTAPAQPGTRPPLAELFK